MNFSTMSCCRGGPQAVHTLLSTCQSLLGLTCSTHKKPFQEHQQYHSRPQLTTPLTQNLVFKDTETSWPITLSSKDLPDPASFSNAFFLLSQDPHYPDASQNLTNCIQMATVHKSRKFT